MPVGRFDDDGEPMGVGSRHFRGRTLGDATIWNCPSCGVRNEGRRPEQGCAVCGAGDPTKSHAGQEPVGEAAPVPPRAPVPVADAARQAGPGKSTAGTHPEAGRRALPSPLRVLRLIEYVLRPDSGVSTDIILRNSLVGRMEMGWGTLTATIVDSCDARQEDLLNMARRQPGVWLANKDAMAAADRHENAMTRPSTLHDVLKDYRIHYPEERPRIMAEHPSIPDTGPVYSVDEALMADAIIQACGLKLANTLALALSQIAPELEANAESEMFISADEALRLANAIMQKMPDTLQIPTVREGEAPGVEEPPPAPAPAPAAADGRVKGVVERMQAASRPTPVFREPPPEEP